MALRFIDGFDHGGNITANLTAKYASNTNGFLNTGASGVRTGTGSLSIIGTSTLLTTKVLPTSGSTAIIGIAMRAGNSASWNGGDLLRIQEGSTVHVALGITASGELTVKRNTTVLGTSAAVITLRNNWYYIEIKTTIHDSAGTYEVRVDGTNVLSATGQDTQNAGTATWNTLVIRGVDVGGDSYLDDLYICDGSGTTNNDFLGDCKVETIYPQTGNGTHTDFTPSTGTDRGAMVDEAVPDSDTTYNVGTTAGQKDSYNYPSLSLTGTIRGIQTNLHVRKTDAGARTVCPVVRSGSTTYDGTTTTLGTSYGYISEVWETDPDTAATWVSGGITAMQVGMKVVT
jgi:hypothetical protein